MRQLDLGLLCAMAIACWLRAWRRRRYEEPPLPDWTGEYLAAFDRLLGGDADARMAMREIVRENISTTA